MQRFKYVPRLAVTEVKITTSTPIQFDGTSAGLNVHGGKLKVLGLQQYILQAHDLRTDKAV